MANQKSYKPVSNSRYIEVMWQGTDYWQPYMSWLLWEYIVSFKYDPEPSFKLMIENGKEIQLHFFKARCNKEIYIKEEEQRKK